ncbi:hypothetical protein OU800_17035 [Pseudomonas sp. GOM7]|uniref:hypothetical protein n=1 Tax=Pseudomonas sp. GOM7 TaxID=2998079 RepID=UPI00227D38FC|nr:hypothetical protein [Pseudomonas sp. GOM7]WAJ36307.1 hypothetical protein OU800_17035 [Pseudomonas sp. GOM7]
MVTEKKFEKYLIETVAHKTSLNSYAEAPANAFLLYTCDAYDAFQHCQNKFTKKGNGDFNKDSEDSLRHISCAILGSLMGHFETYQKSLLAGLIDFSANFPSFDSESFLKHFSKHCGGSISIPVDRLLSFRTTSAQVGYVVSDSLNGWHNPSKVNSFFKSLEIKKDIFTPSQIEDLEVLWQLRHSIVHTGAWLSMPDSQKIKRLNGYGNKPIIFEHTFINALCRKLHQIVKHANTTLLSECTSLLGAKPTQESIEGLTNFLEVTSPKKVWL